MGIDEDRLEGRRIIPVGADGAQCVADELLVTGDAGARLGSLLDRQIAFVERDGWTRVRLNPEGDPGSSLTSEQLVAVIEALRAEGHVVQPNHVFVADACGTPCGPHPADAFAVGFDADPYRANPYRANPYRANPYRANPYRANPYRANGVPRNTAVPAPGRVLPTRSLAVTRAPRVLVLDTGLADATTLPPLLAAPTVTGDDTDLPDLPTVDAGGVVHPADQYLDPVAGHGTFIAGLIEQLAPGCEIEVREEITREGFVIEDDVARAIRAAVTGGDRPDLISLSFGGPVLESPFALRSAVALAALHGVVVVASAGNSGDCTPHHPAALTGVLAVGALGPDGPAVFTNYGPWVDACAPGVDLVSAFFQGFNGAFSIHNGVDVDHFEGWATWSGTSFAAPVAVAALAREMILGDTDAPGAVDRVVRAEHLARIPCLGTVVNC